jgi:hypothetical protein
MGYTVNFDCKQQDQQSTLKNHDNFIQALNYMDESKKYLTVVGEGFMQTFDTTTMHVVDSKEFAISSFKI